MAWTPPKPADNYDTLLKQFRSLCCFTAAIEAQLRYYQMDVYHENKARAQLDGEKAVNEYLTNERELLLEEIDILRNR